MAEHHAVVAMYGSHAGAEAAVTVLQAAGIDTSCLSIFGEAAVVERAGDVIAVALTSIGLPRDRIVEYELELQAGRYLVLAHGSAAMIEHAGRVFRTTRASGLMAHATCAVCCTATLL